MDSHAILVHALIDLPRSTKHLIDCRNGTTAIAPRTLVVELQPQHEVNGLAIIPIILNGRDTEVKDDVALEVIRRLAGPGVGGRDGMDCVQDGGERLSDRDKGVALGNVFSIRNE